VSRSKPSLPNRCQALSCAKRVPWRARLR
jgi:hypothetical protein